MNRIHQLFQDKKQNILSIFCTAGFPNINDTTKILDLLQQNEVDMVEIGMPFSDPTADGIVIQQSNTISIANGMTIHLLFEQLKSIRDTVKMPLILMGYLNPVMQFGFENFLKEAASCGIDGVIIPDLPLYEYKSFYKPLFDKYGLKLIFLITPQTSDERIRQIDAVSDAFIYVVSTQSITGGNTGFEATQEDYFKRLEEMKLKNPCIVGFGIKDKQTFELACRHLNGAIIGSAFIRVIENSNRLESDISDFINILK